MYTQLCANSILFLTRQRKPAQTSSHVYATRTASLLSFPAGAFTGSLPSEQHRDLFSQPLDITDLCSLSKAKQTTWSVPIVCTRSFSGVYIYTITCELARRHALQLCGVIGKAQTGNHVLQERHLKLGRGAHNPPAPAPITLSARDAQ